MAIGALDMRGGRSAEGPQERDGQQWGDQQARAEGQLGSGHVGHREAERVASEAR